MFIITHALSPVIAVATADAMALEGTGQRHLRRRQYVAIALSGALPDLLNPHLTLAARFASWSHTLPALALFVPIALLVARRVDDEHFVRTGLLMAFAYALHLFCDALSGGIAWLYPFKPTAILGGSFVPYTYWIFFDLACVTLTGIVTVWLRRRERFLLDQRGTR